MISRMRPNVKVFRNRRVAKGWLQERAGTFTPLTAAVGPETEPGVTATEPGPVAVSEG